MPEQDRTTLKQEKLEEFIRNAVEDMVLGFEPFSSVTRIVQLSGSSLCI